MAQIVSLRQLLLATAAASLVLAAPALAQDRLNIVITPTKTPTPEREVGNSVTVITAEEIAEKGATTAVDVIRSVPGVTITETGPAGSQSSVFLRGTQSYNVLVLIDGVEVSDPSNTQTSFGIQHLLAADIERIEVLRGSQGTLYGSEAIGGVVNIITKRAAPGLQQSARIVGGSFDTKDLAYSVGGGTDTATGRIGVQYFDTNGFSAADDDDGNREDDGYENLSLTASGEAKLTEIVKLFGNLRYAETETEFDGFPAPAFVLADDANIAELDQLSGRLGLEAALLGGRFVNEIAVAYTRTDRKNTNDGATTFDGKSDRLQGEYLGRLKVTPSTTVLFGTQQETESADIDGSIDEEIYIGGYFLEVSQGFADRLFVTVGGRFDDHEEFGSFGTYRLAAALVFDETGTKLRSSYATGFRAPSLYELFGPFGTSTLDPEESTSFDIGIDQTFFGGRAAVGVTYFNIEVEELIDFDFGSFTYRQFDGTTKSDGVELTLDLRPTDWFTLSGGYTYTDSRLPDGDQALSRPQDAWNVRATARAFESRLRLALFARGQAENVSIDSIGDRVPTDDFVVAGLDGDVRVRDGIKIIFVVDNLFDEDYQEVYGYGTAERSGRIGLALDF